MLVTCFIIGLIGWVAALVVHVQAQDRIDVLAIEVERLQDCRQHDYQRLEEAIISLHRRVEARRAV